MCQLNTHPSPLTPHPSPLTPHGIARYLRGTYYGAPTTRHLLRSTYAAPTTVHLQYDGAEGLSPHGPEDAGGGGDDGRGARRVVHERELAEGAPGRVRGDAPPSRVLAAVARLLDEALEGAAARGVEGARRRERVCEGRLRRSSRRPATHCPLRTAPYALPPTHCPLRTARYALPATHCPLRTARYALRRLSTT